MSYETLINEGNISPAQQVCDNPYEEQREQYEFMSLLRSNIQQWEDETNKERDKRVVQAIGILFDSVDSIDIFNKKAIYLYMREITGLNTKQIVSALTKVKIKYRNFKNDWDDGDV